MTFKVPILNGWNRLSYIVFYALGLTLFLFLSNIPGGFISESIQIKLKDAIAIVLFFGCGIWVGVTWHDYKLEEQRKRMIWRLLTQREQEVAELLLRGKTNIQIGEELFIGNNTVKTHLKNIYRKSGCNGRKSFKDLFIH